MYRVLWVCLVTLASQAFAEDEKFYSIVGADGSVQIIKAPADKEKEARVKKAKQEREQQKQEKSAAKAADKASSSGPESRAASSSGAAYDSEEYVESELLEGQGSRQPEKSRFYIIPDEHGTQVNQDGMAFTPMDESSPVFENAPLEEKHRLVDESLLVLRGEQAVSAYPGLPECLPKEELSLAKEMQPGLPESLLIDKGVYSFLKPPGTVAMYRIPGEGLRTMVASSFSRTDRKPGFVHPYLAFFDGRGCLTRVISNFYETHYPANQRRHPMLKVSLVVHTEESFMVVLVPKETQTKSVASLPYQYSRYGQLKFTVKKK